MSDWGPVVVAAIAEMVYESHDAADGCKDVNLAPTRAHCGQRRLVSRNAANETHE